MDGRRFCLLGSRPRPSCARRETLGTAWMRIAIFEGRSRPEARGGGLLLVRLKRQRQLVGGGDRCDSAIARIMCALAKAQLPPVPGHIISIVTD